MEPEPIFAKSRKLKVAVIQHLAFEDLGCIADVVANRGWHLDCVDATRRDFSSAQDADLLILLGGPISVNDAHHFAFLSDECRLLERRLAAGSPTLGICLGAQLIAQVLGADVYPMGFKEIGFSPLRLTEAGASHPLSEIGVPVLHWHGETYDLPQEATHLASTERCAQQAFCVGTNILALQFHMEVRAQELEPWLVGHIVEIQAAGLDPGELRAQAGKWSQALESDAGRFLNAWFDEISR